MSMLSSPNRGRCPLGPQILQISKNVVLAAPDSILVLYQWYSRGCLILVHSKEFSLPPLKSELKNQLPVPSCVLSIATAIQRVRITYVDVPEPMAVSIGSSYPDLPKCDFGWFW